MNKFIRRFIGFSLGPVIGAIISFFTVPLITAFVSPAEYGKASMFSLFQAIVMTFIYLGIDQAYTREYYAEDDKKSIFQNAVLMPFILSVVLLAIIGVRPQLLSNVLFESPDYTRTAVFFGIAIVFSVVERFILLSIRMQEKAIEFSFFSIVMKVTVFIVAAVMIYFGKRDFLTVVFSTLIGQLLGDALLFVRYRHLLNIKGFKMNKPLVGKMAKFGLPLVFAASLATLMNSSDRLFLRTFSTFTEIGIYTATLKVSQVLGIVQTSFTSFWVPTAYRWHSEDKEIRYYKVISEIILLVMTVVFFALIFSKEIIVKILSPEYIESKYVLALLCLQPILYTLSETTTLGIVFSRKSYLNIWVSVVSILPNIIINLLLTPILGTIGAGIASGISYVFFFSARTYFSSKNGFSFPFKKHFLSIALFLICALINTQDFQMLGIVNLILFALTMVVQFSTLLQIKEIYKQPKNWDFS